MQHGIIGEPYDLVCLIALSSTIPSSSIDLTWNFTSNDNRVTVIPTTITTDDSIGIIYSTVIQFDYLMEGDEGNYTCTLAINGDSAESTFNVELISKYCWLIHICMYVGVCILQMCLYPQAIECYYAYLKSIIANIRMHILQAIGC